MKAWWTKDKRGRREGWLSEPQLDRDGIWRLQNKLGDSRYQAAAHGTPFLSDLFLCETNAAILNAVFPAGIKQGECKMLLLHRIGAQK